MSPLSDGLYESLRTHGLDGDLARRSDLAPTFGKVPSGDVPDVLARHVAEVVRRAIADEADSAARVRLVNNLIATLSAVNAQVAPGVEQLLQLTSQDRTPVRRLTRPQTPLSDSALLTNAKDEPGLGAELRAELESADSVDLLCAFVKWYGLRVLEEQLGHLVHRGVPLRVLTTTYVGQLSVEHSTSSFAGLAPQSRSTMRRSQLAFMRRHGCFADGQVSTRHTLAAPTCRVRLSSKDSSGTSDCQVSRHRPC